MRVVFRIFAAAAGANVIYGLCELYQNSGATYSEDGINRALLYMLCGAAAFMMLGCGMDGTEP